MNTQSQFQNAASAWTPGMMALVQPERHPAAKVKLEIIVAVADVKCLGRVRPHSCPFTSRLLRSIL